LATKEDALPARARIFASEHIPREPQESLAGPKVQSL
jgi:hypothetical protein